MQVNVKVLLLSTFIYGLPSVLPRLRLFILLKKFFVRLFGCFLHTIFLHHQNKSSFSCVTSGIGRFTRWLIFYIKVQSGRDGVLLDFKERFRVFSNGQTFIQCSITVVLQENARYRRGIKQKDLYTKKGPQASKKVSHKCLKQMYINSVLQIKCD